MKHRITKVTESYFQDYGPGIGGKEHERIIGWRCKRCGETRPSKKQFDEIECKEKNYKVVS